jgi:hypothetical protein
LRDSHTIFEECEVTRARLAVDHGISQEWQQRLLKVGRRVLHYEPRRVSALVANSIATGPSGGGDDLPNPLHEWLVSGRHSFRRRIALRRPSSNTLNEGLDAGPVLLILFCELKQLRVECSIESRHSTSRVAKGRRPLRLAPK